MIPGYFWFQQRSIGWKLNIGFGLLFVLMVFVTGLSHLSSTRITNTITQTNEVFFPAALEISNAQTNLLRMLSNIHGYLLVGNPDFRNEYLRAREDFEADLERIREMNQQISNDKNQQQLGDQNQQLDEIQVTYAVWISLPHALFSLKEKPLMNEPALHILEQEAEPFIATMTEKTRFLFRNQIQKNSQQPDQAFLFDLADFQNSLHSLVVNVQAYVATRDLRFKIAYKENVIANEDAWKKIWPSKDYLNSEEQLQFEAIATARSSFLDVLPRIVSALEGERSREDLYIFRTRAVPLAETMLQLLDEEANRKQTLLTSELSRGNTILAQTHWQTIIGGSMAILVGMFLSLLLRISIIHPIKQFTSATKHIAAGNLDERVPIHAPDQSEDEMSMLAHSFNTMACSLQYSQQQLEEYSRVLEEKVEQRTRELSQAIHEAREARDISESANRAKSQFLANMSHELRTPLNSIINFTRILVAGMRGPVNDDQLDYLNRVHSSGKHLLNLINDILDLSKIEAGRMELYREKCFLGPLIQNALSTASGLIRDKPIEIRQDIPDDLPFVTIDKTRIRQVLLNLLSNAAKFTDSGEIVVRAEVVHPNIIVHVSDTGIGIPSEKHAIIFEEFRQVEEGSERKYEGTGLGLSICKRFIEMHQGKIWLTSTPGRGSTFSFSIPAASDPNASIVPETKKHAQEKNGGIPVLVVDDDPFVVDIIASYLESDGYIIYGVSNSQTVIAKARSIVPAVIILDILMPQKDGWEVLRELKECPDLQTIPVILYTILDANRLGLQMGASAYLTKPIDEERLRATVARLAMDGTKILVIDDDPDVRELVTHELQRQSNLLVFTARNGREGIQCITAEHPNLIILDLMMPEVDGFAVLEYLEQNGKNIPVVVLTALQLDEEAQHKLERRVNSFLSKNDTTPEQLLSKINMLLATHHQSTEKPVAVGK